MFFARCIIAFAIFYVVLFFVISSAWSGDAAISGGILFAGILSILGALLYGVFDEFWLQHRKK